MAELLREFIGFIWWMQNDAKWHPVSDQANLLVCVSWTIIGQTGNSIFICRVQPGQAAIQFCQRTGFDNVRHRLSLTVRTQISVCKLPFPSAGTQCPCSLENGSVETTVAEGGRNPVVELWGHTLGRNWPPELTSSYASIDFWCQLVASAATAASWMSVAEMVG